MTNRRPRIEVVGRWFALAFAIVVGALVVTYPIADATRAPLDDAARAELSSDGRAQQFVRTSQGVIHVRVSGPADGPVVLLVHGGAVGGYGFHPWQKPLADAGYRVILPDLLGYGYSERPPVAYTARFYVTQLEELVDGLGVHTPINVIGASLGGAIATAFAAANQDIVTSVALLAPAGGGRTAVVNSVLTWPIIGDWAFRVVGPSTVRRQIATAYPEGPARDAMTAWMREQGRYRGFGEGLLNTIRNYDVTWQPEPNQALGRSDIPVLAVWGTADEVNPYVQSRQLKDWIPQLRLVTLDGIGHAITYGQADTVLAKVIPFLSGANQR